MLRFRVRKLDGNVVWFVVMSCTIGVMLTISHFDKRSNADEPSKVALGFLDSAIATQNSKLEMNERAIRGLEGDLETMLKSPVIKGGQWSPRVGDFGDFVVSDKKRFETQSTQTLKQAIDDRKSKLKEAKNETKKIYADEISCLNMASLTVGQVGIMGDRAYSPIGGEILQILGDDSLLLSCLGDMFIVRGLPTNDLVDGKVIVFKLPLEVVGTESYKTVGGASKTVFSMRQITMEEYAECLEYASKTKPKPPREFRVWKDTSGAFTVEAEYVSQNKTEVELLKKDGSKLSVPLLKLSRSDRAWLKEHGQQ